jgi:DNA-binding MurR/RpiR family transcriptional regulator
MAIDVSKRIRNVYHDLSKGHKRIANIVLREPSKAKDYSAARFAKVADVSESTVMRFVKNIGYESFSEFKNAIAYSIQSQMKQEEKIVVATPGVMRADIYKRTLGMDIGNVKYTLEHIDPHTLSDLVGMLMRPKRKFILAFGNDALPAKLLYDNFVTIFEDVTLITSSDDYFAKFLSLASGDQVVIFSISDKSKELQGLTKYIKSKKAKIAVIVNHPSSPLSEYADFLLEARSETPSFMDSYASTLGIVNALTLEIVQKDRKRVTARYKQIEKIRADFSK